MQNDNTVANIFGEDEQVPRNLPFYLKAMTIKSTNHTASVIAIYVGKLHHGYMSTLITKAPFEDIKLVPLSLSNKAIKRLLTSGYNCTISYAKTAAPSSSATQT